MKFLHSNHSMWFWQWKHLKNEVIETSRSWIVVFVVGSSNSLVSLINFETALRESNVTKWCFDLVEKSILFMRTLRYRMNVGKNEVIETSRSWIVVSLLEVRFCSSHSSTLKLPLERLTSPSEDWLCFVLFVWSLWFGWMSIQRIHFVCLSEYGWQLAC